MNEVYVICEPEEGIIELITGEVRETDEDKAQNVFYCPETDTYYAKDMFVYYHMETPLWVRAYDYKYTPEKGFERSITPQMQRELKIGQITRYKEMSKAMETYDDINTMCNYTICGILEQQLYH